jgi:hypothetical protein
MKINDNMAYNFFQIILNMKYNREIFTHFNWLNYFGFDYIDMCTRVN